MGNKSSLLTFNKIMTESRSEYTCEGGLSVFEHLQVIYSMPEITGS